MGPRRIRRGEPRRWASRRTAGSPCFNGATANSPWRTGPGRGACPSPPRFNGATANSPWRTLQINLRHTAEEALQWGHGEFAVENPGSGRPPPPAARRFNGATANSPWRTPGRVDLLTESFQLQWGHGEFAVENDGVRAGAGQRLVLASMGPRRIRRGERGRRCRRRSRPSRFNGATAN